MSERDEWGNEMGWCNSCGEEGDLHGECLTENCEDGEMVPYEDKENDR